MTGHILTGLALVFALTGTALRADAPEIVAAEVTAQGESWRVSVTLRHPDTGWDHYADGWEVLAQDGTRLGFRELLHPHVEEQPFTRSLSGVTIPQGVTEVFIRARCNVDGWGEARLAVPVSR